MTELRKRIHASDEYTYRPVVVFFTDGDSTDDWRTAFFSSLNNNALYRRAEKVAVALGDANLSVLNTIVFSADDEFDRLDSIPTVGTVIYIDDCKQLPEMLLSQTLRGLNRSIASDQIWPENLKEQEQQGDTQSILALSWD